MLIPLKRFCNEITLADGVPCTSNFARVFEILTETLATPHDRNEWRQTIVCHHLPWTDAAIQSI
jgi:hypothetical protein